MLLMTSLLLISSLPSMTSTLSSLKLVTSGPTIMSPRTLSQEASLLTSPSLSMVVDLAEQGSKMWN